MAGSKWKLIPNIFPSKEEIISSSFNGYNLTASINLSLEGYTIVNFLSLLKTLTKQIASPKEPI